MATVLSLKLLRDRPGPARQWGAVIALGLGILSRVRLATAELPAESARLLRDQGGR